MNRFFYLSTFIVAIRLSCYSLVCAQPVDNGKTTWPPVVDAAPVKPFPGRTVELFRHGSKPAWGYAEPQQDFFILVHPEKPRPDAPLYVVLHSAGHDAKSAYEIATEGPEGPNGHFLYYPPADCYGLFPDCRANGPVGDWWWGGPQPNEPQPKNLGLNPTPAERRVEETVRWAIGQYANDPNRVYLTGISMGGSGSLGIGMPRGDLFASIMVHVPAGALHVEQRMKFLQPETTAQLKLPDPPIVVAYSGVDDTWAQDQATLLKGMHDGKYAFIDFWGLSGHSATKQELLLKCDLAFTFPWLEIKKNEAYPVFTDASSDSKAPWLMPASETSDKTGQINGFFRWKNLSDTPQNFSIELRLLKPEEFQSTIPFPTESTADITLRRLQTFQVPVGDECEWELIEAGNITAKGTIQAGTTGLLTIPRLTIRRTPSVLALKKVP